jgi:hypothetical protein
VALSPRANYTVYSLHTVLISSFQNPEQWKKSKNSVIHIMVDVEICELQVMSGSVLITKLLHDL